MNNSFSSQAPVKQRDRRSRGIAGRDIDEIDFTAEAQAHLLWRILHFHVARYGSVPTGQFLVGHTIVLLNELGRHATVAELTKATGLPQTSVSRYVADQIDQGYLEEVIDPEDRRRRLLYMTAEGHAERERQAQYFSSVIDEIAGYQRARPDKSEQVLTPDEVLNRLVEITRSESPEAITRSADPD